MALPPSDLSRLRVMHLTSAVDDSAPGIRTVVEGAVGAISRSPTLAVTHVGIVPRGDKWGTESADGVHRVRVDSWGPRALSYAPGLHRTVAAMHPNVIHQHGLWQYTATIVRRPRVTLAACVVSPHGMLSPAARHYHRVRKSVAWAFYQRACLADADALHATSTAEFETIRGAGLRHPVAIVPPGVNVPRDCPRRERSDVRIATCISRLHPLKGIVDLVHAWGRVRPAGWRLVVAGPDAGGYRQVIAKAICDRRIGGNVLLRDGAWADERDSLLAATDLFVLPSHSENYGLVVAEALAQGVPVLTTAGTPWSDLEKEGCGWWVPVGSDGLAVGLDEACSLGPDVLAGMGQRGWILAQKTFNWTVAADRLEAVYGWLAGHRSQPDCVKF